MTEVERVAVNTRSAEAWDPSCFEEIAHVGEVSGDTLILITYRCDRAYDGKHDSGTQSMQIVTRVVRGVEDVRVPIKYSDGKSSRYGFDLFGVAVMEIR